MDMERPCDITVTYQDGTRVVHRYVTGERVRELENLPFADPKVVSAESTDSEPRPHGEYFDFHRAVDDLIEQVRDAADPGYLKEPLPALGLAAYVRARFADELGGLVRAARLAGASWEAIGRELGLSKQTAYNRFSSIDPKRWDGVSPRCGAAHAEDSTLCEGDPEAVRIVDTAGGEVTACVHHGARLYASLDDPRVYPAGGPDGPNAGAALEVYHRAQSIKPWAWEKEDRA